MNLRQEVIANIEELLDNSKYGKVLFEAQGLPASVDMQSVKETVNKDTIKEMMQQFLNLDPKSRMEESKNLKDRFAKQICGESATVQQIEICHDLYEKLNSIINTVYEKTLPTEVQYAVSEAREKDLQLQQRVGVIENISSSVVVATNKPDTKARFKAYFV